ncbi:unnamed protein product [Closterium sp. NIES-54]
MPCPARTATRCPAATRAASPSALPAAHARCLSPMRAACPRAHCLPASAACPRALPARTRCLPAPLPTRAPCVRACCLPTSAPTRTRYCCTPAAKCAAAPEMLCPEGDPDALDIPTPRSYAEAIAGEYSSQWQTAMDAKMASWKSTGTCQSNEREWDELAAG